MADGTCIETLTNEVYWFISDHLSSSDPIVLASCHLVYWLAGLVVVSCCLGRKNCCIHQSNHCCQLKSVITFVIILRLLFSIIKTIFRKEHFHTSGSKKWVGLTLSSESFYQNVSKIDYAKDQLPCMSQLPCVRTWPVFCTVRYLKTS